MSHLFLQISCLKGSTYTSQKTWSFQWHLWNGDEWQLFRKLSSQWTGGYVLGRMFLMSSGRLVCVFSISLHVSVLPVTKKVSGSYFLSMEEIFAGRNFRVFANLGQICENLFPQNTRVFSVRKSLFREILKIEFFIFFLFRRSIYILKQ